MITYDDLLAESAVHSYTFLRREGEVHYSRMQKLETPMDGGQERSTYPKLRIDPALPCAQLRFSESGI